MPADYARGQRLAWEYLAHSEIGLVRKNNQDSGLVSSQLLMVADGMGGAAAGDLASAVAVDTMAGVDLSDQGVGYQDQGVERLRRLAAAISAANTRIADLVSTDYTLEGMGTTVTAAVLDADGIGLAHIGDSRGYLFRSGRLEQLTHDHSWVQSLIDEGKISAEEAAAHPHRSLLLKVLNGQPSNEPDLGTVPLYPGDRLLLCSDGLCGFVDDADIAEALVNNRRDAMDQLVEAAHAAGGLDNITIIIADLVDPATLDPEATASRAAIAARHGGVQAGQPAAVQEVDGPINGPQLLGAAADRDVSSEEQQIRDRAARRSADLEGEGEGDFLDPDYEDADEPEDEDRYAPQAPRKRRWRRPLILTLLVILLLAVGAGSGFAWTRTQYYVGAADDNVAIYQGLNTSVPGLPLSRVYEVQKLPLTDLPPYYQGVVRNGIETDTLASARATVLQLKQTAVRCAAPPPPDPSKSPSPKPRKSPTAKSTAKKSPSKPKPGSRPTAKKSSSKPTPSPTPTTPQASQSPAAPGQLPGDGKC